MIKINLRKFYCKCGCGQSIKLKKFHGQYGIPLYIHNHDKKGKTYEEIYGIEKAKELKNIHSKKLRNRVLSEEHKKKLSKAKLKYPAINTNQILFCQCGCEGQIKIKLHHKYQGIPKYIWGHNPTKHTKESCNKIAKSKLGIKNPMKCSDVSKKVSIKNKGRKAWNKGLKDCYSFKTIEQMSKSKSITFKQLWKSSEFAKKMIKSWHIKPTKPELHLQSLLNELYPNEFKYVGDGEVIIAGKCPDFININGKKQIIELFGDYWHKGQKEEDRIKIFEPYGYKTRIIWERELKDINKVIKKLEVFK